MTASEAPKLLNNKPRKSQLKPVKDFAPARSSTTAAPPPQEPFSRRYKYLWPVLLTANLSFAVYLMMRTRKKDTGEVKEVAASVPSTSVSTAPSETAPITEKATPSPPIIEPLKVREPIPEARQRELFKWILEEKRKLKPKDPEEKKRLDEEKAILKQFIQAKSMPSI